MRLNEFPRKSIIELCCKALYLLKRRSVKKVPICIMFCGRVIFLKKILIHATILNFVCLYYQRRQYNKTIGGKNMFKIVSDSGCDFTKADVQKHDITIVPFYVTLNRKNEPAGLAKSLKDGIDITKREFFEMLRTDKDLVPQTAQPAPQDYIDAYKSHLDAGFDVISLTVSSKLSGTYNSATLAANMLKEEYPNRTIMVVDSLSVSIGQGLILHELVKMRNAGLSITTAVQYTQQVINSTRVYFTLETLEYLKRGGRVGPTTALVGGILGLRPVLQITEGAVDQLDSVRGKKKVVSLITEGLQAALQDDIKNVNVCVGHIQSFDDAATLGDAIEKCLNTKLASNIEEVGVSIGTHAGPGAIAIAYCKKYEALVTALKKSA